MGNTDSTMVKGDINITYRSETVVDLLHKRPFQKSLWEEMEGKTETRISRWGIEGHDMPLYNIIYYILYIGIGPLLQLVVSCDETHFQPHFGSDPVASLKRFDSLKNGQHLRTVF